MENILEKLNSEQAEAVQATKGAVLVLAGAGSGKTRVLTSRIAYLIQHGVPSREILAVTFTNKAAKEMRERLENMLGEQSAKFMWVGTFHSICGRILRQDIDNYTFKSTNKKLDKNFTIYDEQDALNVIKQAIKKLNLDDKKYQPKVIKSHISNAKNKMMDAYTYATYARDFVTQKIADVFEIYENTLNNNNAIDFDDMLMITVKLLEQCPEVRQKYYDKFKHILVDEFQDTNLAQYRLVKQLFTNGQADYDKTRSLCVVGDVDQSIYSWRGADYRILLNFKKDFPDTQMIKLEQNYRSTDNILKAANSIIQNNDERVDKVLRSTKGSGEKIVIYEAEDESDEANFIAMKIKQITNRQDYNKCAVLYRTNAQSRSIEEAFMATSIPYKIYGGLKFYDRKEIKDIVAYLKLIYNTNDSVSFRRIINVPKRAIGDTTMQKLQEFADGNDISLFEAINRIEETDIQKKTQSKLKDFQTLILKLKDAQSRYSLDEYIGLVIEKSGYIAELQSSNNPEDETRIENLQELVNVASEFEPEEIDNTLGEFLAQIALVSDTDNVETISNNVTLMTLHSAKGLEFPYVFLAGLEEGVFPHSRTFESKSELEEERRLMYVGVTRAEEELFITYAKRRLLWGDYKYNPPSRFLEEIPSSVMDTSYNESMTTPVKSNFKRAAETIKTTRFNDDGRIMSTSGFGKNFVAPQSRSISQNTNKSFVVHKNKNISEGAAQILKKNPISKEKEAEKIKKFFEDNKIKRKIEEQRRQEKEAQEQKEREIKEHNTFEIFKAGDRVFHEKFGIGTILDVMEVGESSMYTVDFGRQGKKALDTSYAKLKKF